MVVGEPSLMGGEFGDEDERLITRLENNQYDTANVDEAGSSGGTGGGGAAGAGGAGAGGAAPQPSNPAAPPQAFNSSPMTSGPGGPWQDPSRPSQDADKKSPAITQ